VSWKAVERLGTPWKTEMTTAAETAELGAALGVASGAALGAALGAPRLGKSLEGWQANGGDAAAAK